MNAHPLTVTVDPEIAEILEREVAAGRFASTSEAMNHAVRTLDARRRAVAHLNEIADEALADLDDLVDFQTVRERSETAIREAAGRRGA